VSDQAVALDFAPVTESDHQGLALVDPPSESDAPGQASHLPAFMLGTVIGALAGALLGTLVSPHTRAYLVGLYQLVSRRLSSAERDKLRFELLLQ
jgi:hypothetical protein